MPNIKCDTSEIPTNKPLLSQKFAKTTLPLCDNHTNICETVSKKFVLNIHKGSENKGAQRKSGIQNSPVNEVVCTKLTISFYPVRCDAPQSKQFKRDIKAQNLYQ